MMIQKNRIIVRNFCSFNENQFINNLLNSTKQRKKDPQFIQNLEKNVEKIVRCDSMVMILDKIKFYYPLKKELLDKVFSQTNQNFKNYNIKQDAGSLLKGVIFSVCLNNYGSIQEKNMFVGQLIKGYNEQFEECSQENLISIMESIIYNRIETNINKMMEVLLLKLDVQSIKYFPQILNIALYLRKNPQSKDDQKIHQVVENLMQIFFQRIYMFDKNNLLNAQQIFLYSEIINYLSVYDQQDKINRFKDKIQSIMNNSLDKFVIFQLDETINFVKKFQQQVNQITNVFDIAFNIRSTFIQLRGLRVLKFKIKFWQINNLQMIFKNIKNKQCIDISSFVRKILNLQLFDCKAPEKIPTKLINLIDNTYNHNQKELQLNESVQFLYFLVKSNSQYEISQDNIKYIEKLIENDFNILMQSKLLEVCSNLTAKNQKECEIMIQKLEDNIILLSKNNANPSLPLLITFQSLVKLNRGKIDTLMFSNALIIGILSKLNYVELLVKLLPTAAVKTRNLFKLQTNISVRNSAVQLKQAEVINALKEKIIKFWDIQEDFIINKMHQIQPEKYANIVFLFNYANLAQDKYKKIFTSLLPLIENNIHLYNTKQITEIIYAYGRIKWIDAKKLFLGSLKFVKQKQNQFDINQLVSIYWGFNKQKLYDQEFCESIENFVFKQIHTLNGETLSQFLQSYATFHGSDKQKTLVIEKFLRLENYELEYSQAFIIAHAFQVMQLYENIKNWQVLVLNMILHQKEYESNPIFINYLYNILFYVNNLSNNDQLIQLLNKNIAPLIQGKEVDLVRVAITEKKNYVSQFQKKIYKYVNQLMKDVQVEQSDIIFYSDKETLEKSYQTSFTNYKVIPFTIDIRFGNYCFEINGPSHYLEDLNGHKKLDSISQLKKKILQKYNLHYIELPYFHLQDDELIEQYITQKIQLIQK